MSGSNNLIQSGDCLHSLKTLEGDSVDLLVTDPPYGYSFMGKDWDKAVPSVEVWQECLRVLKPGAFAFVMSAPRQDVLSQMIVRLGMAGFDTSFTSIYWTYASGFPKAANVGKLVDKRLGAEREVTGKAKGHVDAGGNFDDDNYEWKPEYDRKDKAATPQAKALDGSYAGFQPKPAVEVIIVAMKPLSEKTYVDQALANGKGITWLDDCRIPYQSEKDKGGWYSDEQRGVDYRQWGVNHGYRKQTEREQPKRDFDPQGRFPANLLVSDDVLNDGSDHKSGGGIKGNRQDYGPTTLFQGKKPVRAVGAGGDSGSYSRYFDLDKWAEKTLPFLIVAKASKSEKDKGLEDMPNKEKYSDYGLKNRVEDGVVTNDRTNSQAIGAKNNHPTVKPLRLMSYLITMGSRPNDLVLDPFCGSGTTCLAAKQLGRRYLGLELSEEYAVLARKRLSDRHGLEPFLQQEQKDTSSQFSYSSPQCCRE